MKNRFFVVKCISTDEGLSTVDGGNYFTPGETLVMVEQFYDGCKHPVYTNFKNGLGAQREGLNLNHPRFLMIAGFPGCRFKILRERQFITRNQSAAWCQIEIDWTRCKRSIRNQARNIAKEHFSCGKLEKIARGYKR